MTHKRLPSHDLSLDHHALNKRARTEPSPESARGFMDLPEEIRTHILGYLLRSSRPLVLRNSTNETIEPLYPQILRTNKQIHKEGLNVLYGENVFQLRIYGFRHDFNDLASFGIEFPGCEESDIDFDRSFDESLIDNRRIRHFSIHISFQDVDQYEGAARGVQAVAVILARSSCIQSLSVTLETNHTWGTDHSDGSFRQAQELLQPLTRLLRNIRHVEASGNISKHDGETFKKLIQGDSPTNRLPLMYDALERLTKPQRDIDSGMRTIWESLEWNDTAGFRHLRTQIVKEFVQHVQSALGVLYKDDDAKDVSESTTMNIHFGLKEQHDDTSQCNWVCRPHPGRQ